MTSDPADLTIGAARAELSARRLSAEELVRAVLARIEARDGELNAYIHVDGERAIAAPAREVPEGPLQGIPLCVKDVVERHGDAHHGGCAAGWRRDPARDAPAVARLRAAGAVIVGKGNTNEFAYGIDGCNPHTGDTQNPRDVERMTGGSSSGPAASLAAGMALGAVGDRHERSRCACPPRCARRLSVCGPTRTRVPREGVVPLSWSYGTPSARWPGPPPTAALLLSTMAGQAIEPGAPRATGREAVGRPLAGTGSVWSRRWSTGVASPTRRWRRRGAGGAERPGREVRPVASSTCTTLPRSIASSRWRRRRPPTRRGSPNRPRARPDVRTRLESGRLVPARAYLQAQRARRLVVEELNAVMDAERLDALAAPTTPAIAPLRGADTLHVAGAELPFAEG